MDAINAGLVPEGIERQSKGTAAWVIVALERPCVADDQSALQVRVRAWPAGTSVISSARSLRMQETLIVPATLFDAPSKDVIIQLEGDMRNATLYFDPPRARRLFAIVRVNGSDEGAVGIIDSPSNVVDVETVP
jgi:hypothetical protein